MDCRSFNWYAVYTRSNFEKTVHNRLKGVSIDAYLPLRKEMKQWSDRKKKTEEPLIRSYVFVRITQKDYFEVLRVRGVVKFVSFSDSPVIIPDDQIDVIKRLLAEGSEMEISSEHFEPGDPVEVIAGKLTGLTGELVEAKGSRKVIVRIEHLQHSLLINISACCLRKKQLTLAS